MVLMLVVFLQSPHLIRIPDMVMEKYQSTHADAIKTMSDRFAEETAVKRKAKGGKQNDRCSYPWCES